MWALALRQQREQIGVGVVRRGLHAVGIGDLGATVQPIAFDHIAHAAVALRDLFALEPRVESRSLRSEHYGTGIGPPAARR